MGHEEVNQPALINNRVHAQADTNTISKFEARKSSVESGTEYRQNLRRVRPRVDCWNRSATRQEVTPNNRQSTEHMNVSKVENRMDTYRKSDSGVKTPVHGVNRINSANAAPIGSFTNVAAQ